MSFDAALFRRRYVERGGSSDSARSYVTYLNRVDALIGGIEEVDRTSVDASVDYAASLPVQIYGGARNKSDSLSALRKYYAIMSCKDSSRLPPETMAVSTPASAARNEIDALMADVKSVAIRYYAATGKPLGVTGEMAELIAADKLRLTLTPARTAGYDATDCDGRRVQIKGRAIDPARPYTGRCPSIKCGNLFDDVVLVLFDRTTMEPLEIWRTHEAAVIDRLAAPGSKARNERHSLGISQFRSIADRVWP